MQTKLLKFANALVRSFPVLLLAVLIAVPACSATENDSSGGRSGSSGRTGGGRGNVAGSGAVGAAGPGGSNAGGSSGSSFGGSSGSSFGGSNGSSFGGSNGAAGSGNTGGASGGNGASGATGSSGASGAGASGGAAGSGGRGGTGGTAGTGSDGGAIGGYMTFGSWHGFAWTATGGTGSIIPPNFGTVTAPPLCASGDLAAGNTNVAMVGVNLNQAATPPNAPAMSVVPTLDGINVSVTNNGTSLLRLQIQGPNGATNENDRWCAPIFGSGGFIPWNAFNTKCWDGTGIAYKKEPIVAAMILVPGGTAAVRFNFCLNNLGAANDPSGPGGGGCSLTGTSGEGTGSITGQFDWRGVTRGGRNYVVQNNVWGGTGSQTLSYSGVSFTVTQQTGNNSPTGGPVSYPSVFIGSNNGRSTSGANLPKQVGSLTTVPTGWSWSGFPSGTFNAAYDVWFSSGAGGDSGNPSGGYLMVWYYKPGNAQPIGGPPAGVASLAGGSWNVWIGQQLGRPIISYVRTETINSLSFDLNDFIKDAVSRGVLTNSMYLSNIFAGFEIWSGGVGLKTDNFCAVVN